MALAFAVANSQLLALPQAISQPQRAVTRWNHIDDLDTHRLVGYAPVRTPRISNTSTTTSRCGRAMPIALAVDNSEAYQEGACLGGLGLIQAPENGLRTPLDDSHLVEALSVFRAEPMPVSLLYTNRPTGPSACRR